MLVDPRPPASLLVVMAHPDDMEFSAGGTIARWVEEGTVVDLCLCTNGDKGTSDPSLSPGEVAAVRERETRAAAAELGVRGVHDLGFPDGTLENTLELRREIVAVIRRLRPAAVMTGDPMRWYGPTYVNHPDHRAAGGATIDAVFPSARDPLAYPHLLRQGLGPHRVAEVYLTNPTDPAVAVDVSLHWERKIAALRCHASQVTEDRLTNMVPERLRENGALAGVEMAELFHLVRLPG